MIRMIRKDFVTFFVSLLLLGRWVCGVQGVEGVEEAEDVLNQDIMKDIFENSIDGYESEGMKKDDSILHHSSEEEHKECSYFTLSAGLRCVSYQDCDHGEIITKHDDKLIDIEEWSPNAGDPDKETFPLDVPSLYCPGKSEICCKDPEFVHLDSLIEDILKLDDETVNETSKNSTSAEQGSGLDIYEDKPKCPPQWRSFQANCYYFGTSPTYLTWAKADSACREVHRNSSLPSLHSGEEDQFIQDLATSHPFWLGGSRNVGASYHTPSSWQWADGTAMNYTAWASGQPNNYWWLGERCVRSVRSVRTGGEGDREGTWDDHRCWSKDTRAVVCKLEL